VARLPEVAEENGSEDNNGDDEVDGEPGGAVTNEGEGEER
jgi:hypothetical protein